MQEELTAAGTQVEASGVLGLVALALSIGLTVALVLGAGVLLLASAAHAAPERSPAAGCSEPKCKGTLYTLAPAAHPLRGHA